MNIKGKLVEIFDTVKLPIHLKREIIIEDSKNPEYPEFIKLVYKIKLIYWTV